MIRNAIIAAATVVTAAAALAAPASANGYRSYDSYDYDTVRYEKVCHIEKRKVFAGYDECGNKLWVWKRVRSCH
ncbi:hypothetical protein E3C22_07155 [Jiella endophytica]|uniref:Uncharacterized protein n=1 Tax=Jiella endophytica TaxID=2558362 RepID=A0A4Y8RNC7_9HYPH|nr:hypothetical protein [Jiella endophytica]TFF25152.1 hypothetical protein E3C22_07155 [Jiella endophytica]